MEDISKKQLKVLRMKDSNESFHRKKGLLLDLPFKLGIFGKSQLSGKTNFLGWFLLYDDNRLYLNEFEGENIYLISASAKTDDKLKTLILNKDIPSSNIFTKYDEDVIETLYEILEENFHSACDKYKETKKDEDRPVHNLMIFDDMSFGQNFKNSGILEKIFCNGRHTLTSSIITAQKYTQIPTCIREQLTGAVLFSSSEKQLELMTEDHNYLQNKKEFKKLFRENTAKKHDFLFINYSNDIKDRYMNSNFESIKGLKF